MKAVTRRRRLPSIRARILTVFLGVLLIVFIAISVVFNALIARYISSTATTQLSAVVANFTAFQTVNGETVIELPDVSQAAPSRLNTRPAIFLLQADYTPVTPGNASAADQQTAQDLAKLLQERKLVLSDVINLMVRSQSHVYYITCVPSPTSAGHVVFYIDVTGIVNFADNVNLRLMVIMVAAVVIAILATVLITRRMTRPLTDLTEFSQRLGSGDFRPLEAEFHDREFATLADSMNQAAHQLDSYDKDQKTFFQNASHELRTPLMSITCYAEGIAYGIMEPQQASRTILSETGRLTEMVEDLLTVSRIDSLAPEQHTARVDVNDLLTAAVDEQRQVAEDRGLALDFAPGDPAILDGNAKTLQRAFANLLSNALRYAASRISVTCVGVGDQVQVTIADDGSGISAEDLPHIFERFYHGADGHHGIGLAIVKSVVDQHHGAIDVRSDISGTTFRLTFPPAGSQGG